MRPTRNFFLRRAFRSFYFRSKCCEAKRTPCFMFRAVGMAPKIAKIIYDRSGKLVHPKIILNKLFHQWAVTLGRRDWPAWDISLFWVRWRSNKVLNTFVKVKIFYLIGINQSLLPKALITLFKLLSFTLFFIHFNNWIFFYYSKLL